MTSACTYSVASSARSSTDTTEHVLRPHTSAHTRTQRGRREADTHARHGIHLSSYVCAIINKSEIAKAADSPLRIPNERSGGGGGGWLSSRALKEGVPNRQHEGANNKDSCHTREDLQTPPIDNNSGSSSPIEPDHHVQ